MDLTRANHGLVRLFAVYSILVAGVWLARIGPSGIALAAASLHLLAAALLLAAGAGGRMYAACWVLWLVAWAEIGLMFRLTSPEVHDATIRVVDRALFGEHLHLTLPARMAWGWLREIMGLAYLSYYGLIIAPPLILALRKRKSALARHAFGLMTVYLGCFAVYLLLPVLGPRMVAAAAEESVVQTAGSAAWLMNVLFAAGDSPGTAFPSSHCAASLAAALLVRRHFGRGAGWGALAWAGLIILSTIYTSNHYAVDAAAGVALAVLILMLLGRRWDEKEGES
jgi:membrane-associated phospholipid phosphatase